MSATKSKAEKPSMFDGAADKARQYHKKNEQQPGHPINVPLGWTTYAIPGDVPEDRRRPLRYGLEDMGYAPLSAAIEEEPSLARIEYPSLPGAEIWVVPEMVARVHHQERKVKHDAAKVAVGVNARKGGRPEGSGMMEQMRA